MREQGLEHVRNLKLCARSCPLPAVFLVLFRHITVLRLALVRIQISGNVHSIVHKAHFLVCSLVLEGVSVFFSEFHTEVDDLRRCIRDLDRICFYVRHCKSAPLHLILQGTHEQSTTQGYNVVCVLPVSERVLKSCTGQTVHRIDSDLQSLRQCFRLLRIIQILGQFTVEELLGLVILLVFDIDTNIHQVIEVLGVLAEVVERDCRMWMQRRHV